MLMSKIKKPNCTICRNSWCIVHWEKADHSLNAFFIRIFIRIHFVSYPHVWGQRHVNARLQYLHCQRTGDTAALHSTIDVMSATLTFCHNECSPTPTWNKTIFFLHQQLIFFSSIPSKTSSQWLKSILKGSCFSKRYCSFWWDSLLNSGAHLYCWIYT